MIHISHRDAAATGSLRTFKRSAKLSVLAPLCKSSGNIIVKSSSEMIHILHRDAAAQRFAKDFYSLSENQRLDAFV
jgi:hypothetical protein